MLSGCHCHGQEEKESGPERDQWCQREEKANAQSDAVQGAAGGSNGNSVEFKMSQRRPYDSMSRQQKGGRW